MQDSIHSFILFSRLTLAPYAHIVTVKAVFSLPASFPFITVQINLQNPISFRIDSV